MFYFEMRGSISVDWTDRLLTNDFRLTMIISKASRTFSLGYDCMLFSHKDSSIFFCLIMCEPVMKPKAEESCDHLLVHCPLGGLAREVWLSGVRALRKQWHNAHQAITNLGRRQ